MAQKLIVIFLLLQLTAGAQQSFHGLSDLFSYADAHSLTAATGRLQQQQAANQTGINKSGLQPKINLYSTADYFPIIASQLLPDKLFGGQDGKFTKVQFGMPYSFASGVELSMPVINFEKWEQAKKTKLQQQQATFSAQAALQELHIQLAQVYYTYLLTNKLTNLNQSNRLTVTTLLQFMEERNKNGLLNPADYNRSKKLLLDIRSVGVGYAQVQQQATINLHNLLNIADTVDIKLVDSIRIEGLLFDGAAGSFETRAAMKEAAATIAVAKSSVEEANKAALPKLNLNSRYYYQLQTSATQSVHFDAASVGLRADFPLFAGNYYKLQQRKAAIDLDGALVKQQTVKASLLLQQQQWQSQFAACCDKYKLLQQKLQLANDNLRIASLNMKEGTMEFDEFNTIFLEYNQVYLEFYQNMADGLLYKFLLTQNI